VLLLTDPNAVDTEAAVSVSIFLEEYELNDEDSKNKRDTPIY
jgi:hypothetical protein